MNSFSLFRFSQIAAAVLVLLFAASAQQAMDNDNHGIVAPDMDTSVKPGNNFYEYCNGAWVKRTEIPADRARGRGVLSVSRHQQQEHRGVD